MRILCGVAKVTKHSDSVSCLFFLVNCMYDDDLPSIKGPLEPFIIPKATAIIEKVRQVLARGHAQYFHHAVCVALIFRVNLQI